MMMYYIKMFFSLVVVSVLLLTSQTSAGIVNECIGSSYGANILPIGFVVWPGQALCDGDVQFGIFESFYGYVNGVPYTKYSLEIRKGGNLVKFFRSTAQPESTDKWDNPFMQLQHDGNLLFDRQSFSGCIVLPGRDTSSNRVTLSGGDSSNESDISIVITDNHDDIVWQYPYSGGCYPELDEICHSVLYKDERISWKEFLCTYDSDGQVEYKYGIDITGSLGLYHYDQLIYRPKSFEWVRGDYLHFQNDGHLTFYEDRVRNRVKPIIWKTDCIDNTSTRLVMTTDGDVQQLNDEGAIVWTLLGSQSPSGGPVEDARDSVPEICRPHEY